VSAEALNELRARVVDQMNASIAKGKGRPLTIYLSDADAALIFSPVVGADGTSVAQIPEGGSTLVWGCRAFFGVPKTYVD
jgi:hypothetical protein